MSLMQINLDLDSPHVKSYKTRANLLAAIDKLPDYGREYNDRFIVVCTPKGRWTAIVILDKSVGGYVGRYPFIKV